jgi:XTP/dITP diphosphohydrolase
MKSLLVATTNQGKLREIRELLAGVPVELISLADVPQVQPPEEVGTTFAENARAKALYYAAATGVLTVAEDSGLEIDALGGAPGVESARFGDAGSSYPEKFSLIYDRLRRVASLDRAARFVAALAVAADGDVLFETQATVEGRIAAEPRGPGGFGYDPIFFYPPFGCTLAEAGDRKSEVSHRGKAFRHLHSWLSSHFLRSSPPP